MRPANTYVRARIDLKTKRRATNALEAMGLSVSDAIRLLMLRVANEQCLPFEIKTPSKATKNAITELDNKKGKKFKNIQSLMDDLNEDD